MLRSPGMLRWMMVGRETRNSSSSLLVSSSVDSGPERGRGLVGRPVLLWDVSLSPTTTMISLPPGTGSIHLLPSGQFPELSFCYPLKIISPLPSQSTRRGLRVVYILSA